MRDLLVITPTREREAEARRLIGRMEETAILKTDLILAVDDDDPSYGTLIPQADPFDSGRVRIVRGPRADVAEWTNRIAMEHAGDYRWLASLGDDHVPVTRGWDSQLCGALSWRPGVAYGNDKWQQEKAPTAAVISSAVVAALGYMAPPGVEHLCIDLFWKRLGEDLGNLKYLPGVIIEHLHPHAGKAPWDASYMRSNHPGQYEKDWAAYEAFLRDRWPDDLARLKEKLGMAP